MACFMQIEKLKKKLYFEGYMYVRDSERNEKTYWRCEFKKTCKGRAHTMISAIDGDEVYTRGEHSHQPDARRKEVIGASNLLRKSARETLNPTSHIVQDIMNSVTLETAAILPSTSLMKRTVLREKQEQIASSNIE
ncbi:unnamed protein product [Phaedon cochleariae]|uniref:FLYWCH-type domain-containing protein n=1 Tax=Phaedon cochleariae TaxID=80249 RepID=A0A9N9SI54_PHACE|nr:unnamed protein product [Phaedon cochleariae]